MVSEHIRQFLEDITKEAGYPALSEAKMSSIADPDSVAVVSEDDHVVAVGAVAKHVHGDGGVHHAFETAVAPAMQFPAFEKVVAQATIDLAPDGAISFWSMRSTLDAALGELGFHTARALLHMAVDLPLVEPASDHEAPTHALRPDEDEALIAVNNAAFATHREAASLTVEDFANLANEPWFDRSGIRVASVEGILVGFCWTKVHPSGEGEIYRIAVNPDAQGGGWGRRLVRAGFDHLAKERGVGEGTLWVDEENGAAVALYESIGMRPKRINREFERPG